MFNSFAFAISTIVYTIALAVAPFRLALKSQFLWSYGKRPDGIFAKVVRQAAVTVFKIGHKCLFPILGIVHRFIKTSAFDRSLLIQPRPESFKDRLLFPETELLSLVCRMIFSFGVSFTFEKFGTELDSLDCGIAVIILPALWHGIYKIPAVMRSFSLKKKVL